MKRFFSLWLAILLVISLFPASALAEEVMTVSEEGIDFIAEFEGYRQYAYMDGGKWYIGYGTTCEEDEFPDGVTEEEARELLREHIAEQEEKLHSFLNKYGIQLTQYQYDALVSFTYNLGTSWINPANRICRYLMEGIENYTKDEIVNCIATWCHVGRDVVPGLAARRLQEAYLFLYGEYDNNGDEAYTYLHFNVTEDEIDHSTVFYRINTSYTQLPTPIRPGYYFQGWYTAAGTQVTADDIAVAPMILEAKWGDTPVADTGVMASQWDNPFPDVSESDWFYAYVKNLNRTGKVNGYLDGTFQPMQEITAGEALKLILVTAGYAEQERTGEHWASGYYDLALAEGFITEGQITDLNATITRGLIAQITALAMGLPASEAESPFADTDDPYAVALYEAAVITGSHDDQGELVYLPDSGIIRSQICAVVWRMYQYVPPVEEPDQPSEPSEPDEPDEPQEPEDPGALGYIEYGGQKIDILEDVEVCAYDRTLFRKEGSVMYYDDAAVETVIGIDVSNHQGDVDWEAVRDDGIEFVILRVGFRGYTAGTLNLDNRFVQNIEGALDAGLKVGVYVFSTAITEEEALEEAELALEAIAGYDIAGPVVFDWEANSKSYRNYDLDNDTLNQAALAFCQRVEEEGYTPMVYFNMSTGYLRYDLSQLDDYGFWFAQYPSESAMYPAMYYNFQMWQYSSSGAVAGIGTSVDMNISWTLW